MPLLLQLTSKWKCSAPEAFFLEKFDSFRFSEKLGKNGFFAINIQNGSKLIGLTADSAPSMSSRKMLKFVSCVKMFLKNPSFHLRQ